MTQEHRQKSRCLSEREQKRRMMMLVRMLSSRLPLHLLRGQEVVAGAQVQAGGAEDQGEGHQVVEGEQAPTGLVGEVEGDL